ncbi:MAG TPA: hypothetical protein P5040_05035 [Smithella sp.]|nr:hypothetical protein [Smithella sp.]HRS97530.1 hypothetical protein [Smithella sp.]
MAKDNRKRQSSKSKVSAKDQKLANFCRVCPVCSHARKTQKGIAFEFVRKIEGGICPFCRAYERVYGRKAHQRII